MKGWFVPFVIGILFYPLLMDIVMPYVGFYVALPDIGLLGMFSLGLLASVVIAFLTARVLRSGLAGAREVVRAWIPGAIGVVIGFPAAVFIGFATYPTIMMTSPSYKVAAGVCDSITAGMTYDEVKAKVGNLFVTQPPIYFDDNGIGQIFLRNDVKNFETNCHIRFEGYKVKDARMMFVWL